MNNDRNPAGQGRQRQLRLIDLFVVAIAAIGMSACGDTSVSNRTPLNDANGNTNASANAGLTVQLVDVAGAAIADGDVSIGVGGVQQQGRSDANGLVLFADLPPGEATLYVSAPNFEPVSTAITFDGGAQSITVYMNATGAWAVGRAIVLGTRMLERASDGTTLEFSADIAVIGADSQALETLTGADFSVQTIDCGWGGPRDCASDADGNATYNFSVDGGVRLFEYRPGGARQPWLTGVLAERSTWVSSWDERRAALKDFFTTLGGSDQAGLFSLQLEGNVTTLTQLGPFTGDGSFYLDAIDHLADPAGGQPAILEGLLETIRRVAEAASSSVPGTEANVLVLATHYVSIADINEASALAQQLGVRISTVEKYNYGFPEMAVRTGGFVAVFDDPRQLGMIFDALDSVLAGTMPHYHMQFRIEGPEGTFVPGGNAKINMRIGVPVGVINRGVWTTFDVAIP